MKGPKSSLNYECNYQNFTQGTPMPTMNKNQYNINYEYFNNHE